MALIHKNNRMTPILTLLTLLCVVCISIGQLLFKKAATALPENPQIIDWVFNGWLFSSLVLYGFTTLGWIWILRHAPDRKSTRLNSSHLVISYAVFCLKK